MEVLLPKNLLLKDTAVVTSIENPGISRERVIPPLKWTRTPLDLRGRLKGVGSMMVGRLPGVLQVEPKSMRRAVGRMLERRLRAKAG